jgi:hypothetical protein
MWLKIQNKEIEITQNKKLTGPEAIPMRMLTVPRLGSSSFTAVRWAASIAS